VAKRDILLKFHEKSGQFVAAAQSTAISFPLRIVYLVYLSPAVVWAKAAEASSFDNASQWLFLYQMQEKIDFANLLSLVLGVVSG
jgi:hypothetical protein